MLHEFVTANREELIRRCRAKVAARPEPRPATSESDQGIPLFLDQLVDVLLDQRSSHNVIDRRAGQHGRDLQAQGFSVSQVVHGYGDVCQSITDLAVETAAPISVDDFRTLNRCLDDAIASAVTEYGRVPSPPAAVVTAAYQEQFGFFVHELRNLVNTASMAFAVLDSGDVGVRGSTGRVLKRSLTGLAALIDRSAAEVRLGHRCQERVPVAVAGLIEELTAAAEHEAATRGLHLKVQPGAADVQVCADPQILSAVVVNLLQNGFKFTRPGTGVTLVATTTGERVLIEVADECGGLAAGDAGAMFRPFEQRHSDRSGLGLGLAFSKWGAEVNDGRISVRSVPGRGCVFTLDLPRVAATTH